MFGKNLPKLVCFHNFIEHNKKHFIIETDHNNYGNYVYKAVVDNNTYSLSRLVSGQRDCHKKKNVLHTENKEYLITNPINELKPSIDKVFQLVNDNPLVSLMFKNIFNVQMVGI